MEKKIYFLSDTHLGSASHIKQLTSEELEYANSNNIDVKSYAQHKVEKKICRWLDMVKLDADKIYLLGDVFDYWFEYKNVVPRGFVRFLGKITELIDSGIEIHFFIGNHDVWTTDYLQKECGMIVHKNSCVENIMGKQFFLAHGDGLGDNSWQFQMLRKIFHSNKLRKPFASIHPRWTVGLAHRWSNHSRITGEEPDYLGEDKEHLVLFAKQQLQITPDINFFIFGHRHIMLDLMLSRSSRIVILGDWIKYFSYGVFDGNSFQLEIFEE